MRKTPMAFRILIPTDLSENSLPAIAFAMTLSQPLEAELDLLHVVDSRLLSEIPTMELTDPELERQKMQKQVRTAQELQGLPVIEEYPIELHSRFGVPHDEINAAANILNTSLMVVATHGRTGLSHLLMGSVAEQVLKGALCPVLSIRTGGTPESLMHAHELASRIPRRILVATDFSEGSKQALSLAGTLADRLDATLTLVHVLDINSTSTTILTPHHASGNLQSELLQEAGESLRSFLEANRDVLDPRVLEAPVLLQIGDASAELVKAAHETAADLLVLGRHGYSGFRRLLMGSVAESVVRTSPCPVLTIPDVLQTA